MWSGLPRACAGRGRCETRARGPDGFLPAPRRAPPHARKASSCWSVRAWSMRREWIYWLDVRTNRGAGKKPGFFRAMRVNLDWAENRDCWIPALDRVHAAHDRAPRRTRSDSHRSTIAPRAALDRARTAHATRVEPLVGRSDEARDPGESRDSLDRCAAIRIEQRIGTAGSRHSIEFAPHTIALRGHSVAFASRTIALRAALERVRAAHDRARPAHDRTSVPRDHACRLPQLARYSFPCAARTMRPRGDEERACDGPYETCGLARVLRG